MIEHYSMQQTFNPEQCANLLYATNSLKILNFIKNPQNLLGSTESTGDEEQILPDVVSQNCQEDSQD
ncbi:hypothetical protein AV530_014521 [Patagioenas fasciata monilis]|uniref:Uncharacterized protein n=1 Tax=Patagioenas fasciata monilis TaxID=372326 RepID=A0A1V4KC16_PATFA|nr:hypothetical protein AV530_014521 [Patagioenas fasciata monilis]